MVAMAMPAHTMAEDTMVTILARGLLMPSPQLLLRPLLKLILGTVTMAMAMALATMVDIVDTMDMAGHMPMDTVDTGEGRKGPLRPSLPLSPLLMLILGTDTMAMAADTMAMVLDTMAMAMAGLTIADTEDTTGVDFPSLGY